MHMQEKNKDKLFWKVVIVSYFLSAFFSYIRVYIRHDYPVYTKEEDIPDALIIFEKIGSFFQK